MGRRAKAILIGGVILVILFGLLLYSLFSSSSEPALVCVPASCCHATSCVPVDQAPLCDEVLCTQECKPGTLDCGQASCQSRNNSCILVPHA